MVIIFRCILWQNNVDARLQYVVIIAIFSASQLLPMRCCKTKAITASGGQKLTYRSRRDLWLSWYYWVPFILAMLRLLEAISGPQVPCHCDKQSYIYIISSEINQENPVWYQTMRQKFTFNLGNITYGYSYCGT